MDEVTEHKDLTRRAAKGLSWSGATLLARTILNIFATAVLARLLSPQEYGVVSAALIVGAAGNIIANLGMSQVVVQRKDLDKRHMGTILFLSLLIAAGLAVLQWLFAGQIADLLRVPELSVVARVLAVVMVANAFILVAEATLSRHLKFKVSSIAGLVAWIASHLGLAIPLAYLGFSYWALVVAYMAETFILASIYFFVTRDHLVRPSFDMESYRDIRRQSLGYSLSGISAFTALNIDNVIVARLLGTAELGIYSRAYYLIAKPSNLLGDLNRKVAFPLLSKVHDNKARLRNAQLKGYALTAALAMPLSAFLGCFAHELVLTVLGQRWIEAVIPIIAFSGAIYFRVGYKVCGAVMLAVGRSYQMASLQVVNMALVASAAFFSAPYGVSAVAAAVSGAIVTSFVLYAAISCRVTGLSFADFFLVHVPPASFAAAVFASGSTIKLALAGAPEYLVLAAGVLIIGGLSTVALYFRASLLFGKHGVEILQSVASKKAGWIGWTPS